MFAFIALDEDGTEGVVGYPTSQGMLPLVGADMARVDSLRPYAQQIARSNGVPVTLVRFSVREDIETYEEEK